MSEMVFRLLKEVFYTVGVVAVLGMILHCFFRRSAASWWGIGFAVFAVTWRAAGRIGSSRYAAMLTILAILFAASFADMVHGGIGKRLPQRWRRARIAAGVLLLGLLLVPPVMKCFRYAGKREFKRLIPVLHRIAAEKPAGAPIYARHDAARLTFFSGVEIEPYPDSLQLERDPDGYWEKFFEKRRHCVSPMYLVLGDSDADPVDDKAWRKKLGARLRTVARVYSYRRKERRLGIYLYTPEVVAPETAAKGRELFRNGSCEKAMSDTALRKLVAPWAKKCAFYRAPALRLPDWPKVISGSAELRDKFIPEVSLVSDGALRGRHSLRCRSNGAGGVYLERIVPAGAYLLSFHVRGKPGAAFAISTYDYSRNKPMKPGASRVVILPDDKVHRVALPFPRPDCDEMLFLLLPPRSELLVDDLSLKTCDEESGAKAPKADK